MALPDKTPNLEPLDASHAYDDIEAQTKALMLDIFREHVREQERQLNVYGAPHLGNFSLIERWIKADGLAVLRGNNLENMRYLFKAWRSRNPKRGMHFLRTYLQLLWPNGWRASQLWQRKNAPYPTALVSPIDVVGGVSNLRDTHYLTSRINIDVVDDAESGAGLATVTKSISAALGAKFVVFLRSLRVGKTTFTAAGVGTQIQTAFVSGTPARDWVVPTLLVDPANPVMDPLITFTRNTSATMMNDAGTAMVVVGPNVIRREFVQATGKRGWLIEDYRTNLIPYADIEGAIGATPMCMSSAGHRLEVSAERCIGPNGQSCKHTIGVVQADTNLGYFWCRVWPDSTYTATVYVWVPVGNTHAPLYLSPETYVFANVVGYLSVPTVATKNGQWQRVIVTFRTPATTPTGASIALVLRTQTGLLPAQAGQVFWSDAWQCEPGAVPSSFIPTLPVFTGRATAGTFIGSDGNLQTAAAGVVRMQYDPLNLSKAPVMLLEQTRTNLFLFSEQFDNAVWGKTNTSVVLGQAQSPNGSMGMAKLVTALGFTGRKSLNQTVSLKAGVKYTFSVFLKKAEKSTATIFFDSVNFVETIYPGASVVIDLNSGTASDPSVKVQSVGRGVYRCSISATANLTFQCPIQVTVGAVNGGDFVGDGVSGIYVGGEQFEEGAFASSYILTTTAAVTRAADVSTSAETTRTTDCPYVTGPNFSSMYTQGGECTLYAEADVNYLMPVNAVSGWPGVVAMTTDNYDGNGYKNCAHIYLNDYGNDEINSEVFADNVLTYMPNSAIKATAGVPFKVALSFKPNYARLTVSGQHSVEGAPASYPPFARLLIGQNRGGTPLGGHIYRLAVIPKSISDAERVTFTN